MLFHVKQHYLFLENQLKKKVSSVIINIEIEKVNVDQKKTPPRAMWRRFCAVKNRA